MKMTFSQEGNKIFLKLSSVMCLRTFCPNSNIFGNLSCVVKNDPSINACGKLAGKLSGEVTNNNMSI